MELVPFAGKIAPMVTVTMELSAPSQPLTAEASVESALNQAGRNGVFCTIQSVGQASITSVAAFAHQIVRMIRPTLVSHAQRSHTEELQEHHSLVHQDSK